MSGANEQDGVWDDLKKWTAEVAEARWWNLACRQDLHGRRGRLADQPTLEDEQDRVDDLRADERNEQKVADGQPLAEDEQHRQDDWADHEYDEACLAAGGEGALWARIWDAYHGTDDRGIESEHGWSDGRQVLAVDGMTESSVAAMGLHVGYMRRWVTDVMSGLVSAGVMVSVSDQTMRRPMTRLVLEAAMDGAVDGRRPERGVAAEVCDSQMERAEAAYPFPHAPGLVGDMLAVQDVQQAVMAEVAS